MTKRMKNNGTSCSFCGSSQARAFKVAGLVLRHSCDECFVSRCISCGILCIDKRGRNIQRIKYTPGAPLYCNKCSLSHAP